MDRKQHSDTGGHIRPSSLPEGPIGVGKKNGGVEMIFLEKNKHNLKLHFRNVQILNGIKKQRSFQQWNQKQESKTLKHEIGFVAAIFKDLFPTAQWIYIPLDIWDAPPSKMQSWEEKVLTLGSLRL